MSAPVIIQNKSEIDVADVRQFVMDRSVKDNLLDMDLNYSDEDIRYAMQFAAMDYNETPPKCDFVKANALPFGLTFLWGVGYYLLLGQINKLTRQDIDYSAGNVTVDLNKRRIEHLYKLLPMYSDEFKNRILQNKVTINVSQGYACL